MKRKFTASAIGIVALALLISAIAGIYSLQVRECATVQQHLYELLNLLDAVSATTDPVSVTTAFQTAAPHKRLTVISADGTVISDTADESSENHRSRPEIQDALTSGWGVSVRLSETVHAPLLYVAKKFSDDKIVRAAMPLSSLDALVWDSLPPFFLALCFALVLSFCLSQRVARELLKPLAVVDESLRGVLTGYTDATKLAHLDTEKELQPILRSIAALVERLGKYVEEIKTERDKVGLLLDCMDEGLVLLDEDGGILALNGAARTLFALPKTGEGSIQVLLKSRRVREALTEVQKNHAPVMLDLNHPAWSDRELRLFLSPVTGRQYEGRTVGTSILISDVTKLKKAENVRAEFTANVSHELKTPLTSIKGFTEMLASGMVKEQEDQQRFLTMIGVEVDRLISLINDILKLSELENAAIEEPDEAAYPLKTAQETAGFLAPMAESRGVRISVSGMEGAAKISEGRLRELLLNLMENAVKYSREQEGNVDVTVEPLEKRIRISVTDNGIGIPEEARERVFERFYRVDQGRSRENGGTGLGLAIVKHICQLYGGEIALQSVVEEGSVFTVWLPRVE